MTPHRKALILLAELGYNASLETTPEGAPVLFVLGDRLSVATQEKLREILGPGVRNG